MGTDGIKWILVVVRVIIHDGRECERKEERKDESRVKKEESHDELRKEM